ncbi:MAG TPA: type II secretion system protein N [Gammaproteobacteria bacterium]|nr:type II secretion system protein N [Gammaproteobacteria bacterium]
MIDELLSPLFTTEWGRRAGMLLSIVMSLLVFITFIHAVYTLVGDIRLTHIHSRSSDHSLEANEKLNQLIATLPERHLFGQVGVLAQSAILPVTSLQIRLVGVIKSTPETFSRVIISEENRPGQIYRTGDTLPSSGVRIYAITPEGVVLDNGGRLEKLPLARPPLLFQGMPKSLGE